jgi:hypothetical protein
LLRVQQQVVERGFRRGDFQRLAQDRVLPLARGKRRQKRQWQAEQSVYRPINSTP